VVGFGCFGNYKAYAAHPLNAARPPLWTALRSTALVVVSVLALGGAGAAAPAGCESGTGLRVVLISDAVDPDVFLWDSRERLIDYSAGQWGDARAIFAHTLLAHPGTIAVVMNCVSGVAHPRDATGDQDAVGVKILSGPYKGRFGWVLSSDVRPLHGSVGRDSNVVGSPGPITTKYK